MSGFLTNGLPALALFSGAETLNADSQQANGANPQSEKVSFAKLCMVLQTLQNSLSKTMVAGSIYYSQFDVGFTYTPTPRGTTIPENEYSVTGVNIPVGATGGTDTWHVGLYNSAGVLVGRSATAGVTAGTALTIQQIPFHGVDGATLAPITIKAGTYYIALQSNGTTANFRSINSPIWPLVTGSQTGVAGTLAAITPPADYTANLGPLASLY